MVTYMYTCTIPITMHIIKSKNLGGDPQARGISPPCMKHCTYSTTRDKFTTVLCVYMYMVNTKHYTLEC